MKSLDFFSREYFIFIVQNTDKIIPLFLVLYLAYIKENEKNPIMYNSYLF